MFNCIIIILASFGISFVLTPLFKLLSYKFNILDQPGPRKIHAKPIPLLGGLDVKEREPILYSLGHFAVHKNSLIARRMDNEAISPEL